MCLYLTKNSKIETSPRSITVYKWLDYNGKSPYRSSQYRCGELKTTPYFTQRVNGRIKKVTKTLQGTGGIFKGIHAYASLSTARRHSTGRFIVECSIPRRTPFIRGRGEIAALALCPIKAKGRFWAAKEFNNKGKKGK